MITIVKAADIIDVDRLANLVENGWIDKKPHKIFPYDIYCYSRKTELENKWDDPVLHQARGLIIDRHTGELIARPFDKFFNLGTMGIEIDDFDANTKIRSYDKLDGCFAICYLSPEGEPFWTTKGSFNSDEGFHMNKFAKSVEYLKNWSPAEGETVMCEYVGENSRIVLDYDEEALVLLGSRNMITGKETFPEEVNWNGPISEKQPYDTISQAIENWNVRENVEGQVVTITEGKNAGLKIKLKTDDYFHLHWQASRISYNSVYHHLFDVNTRTPHDEEVIKDFIASLPDEFRDETWNMVNEFKNFVNNEIESKMELLNHLPENHENLNRGEIFKSLIEKGIDKKDAGTIMSLRSGQKHKIVTAAWTKARKHVKK